MKVNYLNYINETILGSLGGKQDRIDATDHLIFNVHHLFGLNLVKKLGIVKDSSDCFW